MRIVCQGHSKFLITLSTGYCIVTDPFDASTGYPVGKTKADAVLVSHHHHDHDAVETVEGYTKVVDTAGVHTLEKDIQVTAVSSFHDPEQGKLRGTNLIMVLEAEGLKVVHLGDLGHPLDGETAEKIGRPDLLLVPVGGHFTIDAAAACGVCSQLKPRIILPMHYKTSYNSGWPIQDLKPFLDLCREKLGLEPSDAEVLRVTREDLSCQPGLCVLKPVFD